MTPFQFEQVEILRRIAERGMSMALGEERPVNEFVDIFQHLLDELDRLSIYESRALHITPESAPAGPGDKEFA